MDPLSNNPACSAYIYVPEGQAYRKRNLAVCCPLPFRILTVTSFSASLSATSTFSLSASFSKVKRIKSCLFQSVCREREMSYKCNGKICVGLATICSLGIHNSSRNLSLVDPHFLAARFPKRLAPKKLNFNYKIKSNINTTKKTAPNQKRQQPKRCNSSVKTNKKLIKSTRFDEQQGSSDETRSDFTCL